MQNFFSKEELECPCCGINKFNQDTLDKLNVARLYLGKPIVPNSAYRCEHYNAEVGGKETSAHLVGKAMDIACGSDSYRYDLVEALKFAGFKRIGIAKTFVHVDDDETKNEKRMWVY